MVQEFNRQFRVGQGGLLVVTATQDIPQGDQPRIILVDATAGPVTITLFSSIGIGGKRLCIKKIDSSINAVTITPSGSETIDGAASDSLANENDSIDLVSDNENWIKPVEGVGQGAGGGIQSVKPIDIAFPLESSWLFDQFQYDDIATFLEHWTVQGDAAAVYTFLDNNHRATASTPASNGDSAQFKNLYRFRAPVALVDRTLFFRIIIERLSGFVFGGFVTGNLENSATDESRLNGLGDGMFFFTNGGNWQAVTQDGSSPAQRTVTDTGVAAGGAKKLEARMTVNGIEFYIDGNLVATHTTDIPLATNSLFIIVGVSANANAVRVMNFFAVSASSDREG